MHNFAHGRLPLSFSDMWTTNRNRNPDLVLKNADDYYVPAHKMACVKRFPFFQFPKIIRGLYWSAKIDDTSL
jgi:hypothetical protein